jgi:hypothetical protein
MPASTATTTATPAAPAAPELRIRIKKNADGTGSLACVRADGSTTWQRQGERLARFFPLHDLTHYAVETALGFRRGFYGLVAEGWDIGDFGTPWPRGRIPADAEPAELVVGALDQERATGVAATAADVNATIALQHARHGPARDFTVTDDDLARARAVARPLHERWLALPPGETLELPYSRPAMSGSGAVPRDSG